MKRSLRLAVGMATLASALTISDLTAGRVQAVAESSVADAAFGASVSCQTSDGSPASSPGSLVDGDDTSAVTFTGSGYADITSMTSLTCTVDMGKPFDVTSIRQYAGQYGVQQRSTSSLLLGDHDCPGKGLRSGRIQGSADGVTWQDLSTDATAPETDVSVNGAFEFVRSTVAACMGEAGLFTLSVYAQVTHDVLSDADVMDAQATLDNAADMIYTASDQLANSGYTSLTVHQDTMSIELRWVGPIPTTVQHVIDSVAPLGVVVNVLASHVSLQDQQSDVQAIVTGYQQLGFTSNSLIEPRPDGSGGIDIFIDGTATDALRQLWAAHHVVSVSENYPVDWAIGRQADVSPYWAGARIVVGHYVNGSWQQFAVCSDAFGVHDSKNHYLLAAAHCGSPAYPVRTGNGHQFGMVSGFAASNVGADDMMIFVNPPETSGYDAWAGAWNTTSQYRQVIGSLGSSNGDFVCTSGSFSGERCNIKVTNINGTGVIQGNSFPVVIATQQSGSAAACKGDSGGPVYSVTTGPGTQYDYAKGIISVLGGTQVSNVGAGTSCYTKVGYRLVRTVLAEFHVSLN